tara:strand:+ start:1713 stop:2003 length:291 start_codon:yes stop_codon:yes gene_type:complete
LFKKENQKMTVRISHISADKGKLELWSYRGGRGFGKLEVISSDPKIIAKALNRYGYEDRLSFSSSFEFGEEAGFKTDDEPSNILDKAFEIVIGKGE